MARKATRNSYVNKKRGSKEFHEKREARIRSIYNADEIEYRILNGDGEYWIKDPYETDTVFQPDRFHIRQEIKRKLNWDKEAAKAVYQYLNHNKERLMPYQKRGINFPKLPEVKYGNMGVQENQNCTVITMRMKGNWKRWSVSGANNMAKLLYRKENKELAKTGNRYAEGLISNIRLAEIITTLSAAKAPKKDRKRNPYIDVINMHVPMSDAVQTASRWTFAKALM